MTALETEAVKSRHSFAIDLEPQGTSATIVGVKATNAAMRRARLPGTSPLRKSLAKSPREERFQLRDDGLDCAMGWQRLGDHEFVTSVRAQRVIGHQLLVR
jgi:hypothetical protein